MTLDNFFAIIKKIFFSTILICNSFRISDLGRVAPLPPSHSSLTIYLMSRKSRPFKVKLQPAVWNGYALKIFIELSSITILNIHVIDYSCNINRISKIEKILIWVKKVEYYRIWFFFYLKWIKKLTFISPKIQFLYMI